MFAIRGAASLRKSSSRRACAFVRGRGSEIVASVIARVVLVGSLHFGVKVSLAEHEHERDASICRAPVVLVVRRHCHGRRRSQGRGRT